MYSLYKYRYDPAIKIFKPHGRNYFKAMILYSLRKGDITNTEWMFNKIHATDVILI